MTEEPFSEERAGDAFAWIYAHRAACSNYAARKNCDDCKWWLCACGAEATTTPTYEGFLKRGPMCQPCEWQWHRDLDMHYALSSLPKDCIRKNMSLTSPELTTWCPDFPKWQSMMAAIVGDRNGCAVFYGPKSGVGKTTLAICAMRAVMERGRQRNATFADVHRAKNAFFTTADQIVQDRSKQRLGSGQEAPIVDRAIRASVLVIDELGAEIEKKTGAISEVIDARDKAGRCTWVTTFLTQAAIIENYGAGTHRRLTQDNRIVHLTTPGRKT